MPRKVYYGVDYEDEYDMYDDYDYDHDHDADIGGDAKASLVEKERKRIGLWQCSICTYDNDENLPYCEICGVIRDTSKKSNNNSFYTADVSSKDNGVSTMAQSVFTPVLSGISRPSIVFRHLNGVSQSTSSQDSSKSYQNRNVQADFSDLPEIFMAPQHSQRMNTVPFQFDSPSPDDLVSAGKNASKCTSKAKSVLSTSLRASTGSTDKKGDVKLSSVSSASTSTSTSNIDEKGDNVLSATEASSSIQFSEPSNPFSDDKTYSAVSQDKAENVANSMQNLNLHKTSLSSRKGKVLSEYKPEKWMLNQDQKTLKELNLAIVGHVDSGKSTLSGRLLHLLGRVSQREVHKFEKEAKEKGKGSFAYAWALDESSEERKRGVTMTVAVAYFDTKNYHVVLLDSPGHKDFIPNMISGAAQADAAVFVIDASMGAFEAGMGERGAGQTREHAQLIRSFGVEQIVVLVNKMDVVGYSKERFDFIKSQLSTFLRTCQFKESCVAWIPASAMENQNLVKSSTDGRLCSWYHGPCLLEAIESLRPPERDVLKPLRMPICEVIGSRSSGNVATSGKLETGAIRNGSKVLVMPSGQLATVRSIEHDSHVCSVARAGDNVTVSLHNVDAENVISGGVLCHPDFPVSVGKRLELKIYVLDITMPIIIGSEVVFHTHHTKEPAKVSKILSVIDQKTKKASKRAPRLLTAKQSAVIEVFLERSVCVEEFSRCRALGRAFLRNSGNTIAVGTVSRITDE